MSELPILRRFPGLAAFPRASFGTYPTPVSTLSLPLDRVLLVKRDDLSGTTIGGNKVRGLEWLLGGLRRGERVLTVGPRGSTHGLATALCARAAGAEATVVRWNQPMNEAARKVDERMVRAARVIDTIWVAPAYALAATLRMKSRRRWIRAGGVSPLAVLGHVNAALELLEQVARRECELPERVFVPFGTGSTAAGLALGFRLAGLSTRVVGVRVVPRIVGKLKNALMLAHRTARLLERTSGARVPRLGPEDLTIEHGYYGRGYGKPLRLPPELDQALSLTGIRLDDTYSRKAYFAAARHAATSFDRTMLWLTFDGRLLS